MIENKSFLSRVRVVIIYTLVIILGFACFYPLWNIVCVSFSGNLAVSQNRVSILPVDFTIAAYEKIIGDTRFWRSFGVSTFRVVLAVAISLPLMLMMAYAFTKTKKDFKGRNFFMGLMLVAMLFSGGMVPTFLWLKELGLMDTVWVLILPSLIVPSHVIMMMNFMKGLPSSIEEAAIVDGATPWQILWRIIVPCSKPVIATIVLFVIVAHWNDFMGGVLYIYDSAKMPLMTYINSLNVNLRQLVESGNLEAVTDVIESGLNAKALNSAKIVVSVLPLLLIYPFLQKYLITGLVLGSVKE